MMKEVFKKIADELIIEMKAVIPKATGKTASSLEAVVTSTGFEILGDKHIGALIYGRKPTSTGAKKGDPTLQESILEWLKVKSIQPRESSMTQESLSWAISKSIHKNGYKGKGNFFNSVLNSKKFDSISERVLNAQVEITSNILKL